jgi:hypothetical protein
MKIASALILSAFAAAGAHATDVIDDFESGTDPNGWGWLDNSGSAFTIQPDGGNPGAWLDSGVPYFSDHPNLTAFPAAGTPLRAALDSGKLTAASADFQRIDGTSVTGCFPTYDLPSTFTLQLNDMHSVPTDPPTLIEAHTTNGPVSPLDQAAFPWMPVSFTIPSDATETPPGWVLNAPPDIEYTWADLMRNIDFVSFFVVSPEDLTYDACWHLGVDNVVVSYAGADDDAVFVDGFDPATR